MVYSIGWKNPFPTATIVEYMDGSRKDVDFEEMDILRERIKYRKGNPLEQGFRVKKTGLPSKMMVDHKDRQPLDSINHNLTVISTLLAEVIEQFEPETHQCIPLVLHRLGEKEPFAHYYTFNICNRIDSVDAEHTTYEFKGDYETRAGAWEGGDPERKKKHVFSLKAIGNRHLWRDPHMGFIYCSDALGKALIDGEFTGLLLRKKKSI